MQIMLGLLPPIACVTIVVMMGNLWPEWGWRRAFVRGVVVDAAYMVLATEGLSLVHGIHQASLVVVWAMPMLVGVGLWVNVRRNGGGVVWPPVRLPGDRWVLAEGATLGLVLLLTGLVAWLAPPQTWDSLTYHMARVAHWAQNGSIAHYATGIERQNLMSPGAEMGMLQFYVLGQSDRLVNFVQWFAMVASVITAALVAGELGAEKRGQAFAAVFVATLPMGISEATSTMTDYVVALWLICLAYEAVAYLKGRGGEDGYVFMGLASGLAVLAKPTSFPYLLPFVLVLIVGGLRQYGWHRLAAGALLVGLMVGLVNLGYVARNLNTYGGPFGPRSRMTSASNEIFNGKVLISNLLRNASLQMGTPWPAVNRQIFRGIVGVHFKLGIDPNDPRTSAHQDFQVIGPNQNETRSNNLLHALLMPIVLGLLGVHAVRDWRRIQLALLYTAMIVVGFVVFSGLYKFTPFGSRYELPFFVLMAPAAAASLGRLRRQWLLPLVGVVLLVYAWPWLVGINQRPLLPDRNGRSLLTQPRQDFYFANAPGLDDSYRKLADDIQGSGCTTVGVLLGGDAAEYPLFVDLGAPSSPLRLEWIVAGTPSARYRDPNFVPCAAVCDVSCPQAWKAVGGLPLAETVGSFRLYSSGTGSAAPGQ